MTAPRRVRARARDRGSQDVCLTSCRSVGRRAAKEDEAQEGEGEREGTRKREEEEEIKLRCYDHVRTLLSLAVSHRRPERRNTTTNQDTRYPTDKRPSQIFPQS